MLIVFREQQKLDFSYLGYLIYHKATLIVNTAGGECGGGGGGGGRGRENTEIEIHYLVQKKNNKNYLHPFLPPLHAKVDYPQCNCRLLPFVNGGCHHW